MNMSASNKNMIMVIIGIIILVATYFLGVSKMLEQKKTIDNEVTQLQTHYNELLQKSQNKEIYEQGIVEYGQRFDEKMNEFPASLDQEYTIEFIEGIRQAYDFDTKTLSMGEPEQFYILGASANASANLDATATSAAETTEAPATEAAADGAVGTPAAVEPSPETDNICYKAEFPITYEGSYDGIKEMLDYVANYRYRMTVDTTNIAYDEENDLYTGDIVLSCYAIAGPDRSDDPLNLDIESGKSNIFTNGGASTSATKGMTKYDDNDGAAISSSYDVYVMLNPADSDVSAKAIGQKGKTASEVKSSENTEEDLKLDFYAKDGKNYVTYTLGTKSYEAEITSADDATVYVTSAARKDAEDKSSVKVTISNTMSIPVYVKVSGDDATSPRFNVTSKSGQVKIYK